MGRLKVTTREIGSVCVFDLEGEPTKETLQDVVKKIQRNIRRHRLQRVILNLQRISSLDALGLRQLLTACSRPQKSLIYGANPALKNRLEETYVPMNVRVCGSEKEVAEDFGPFLLEREKDKEFVVEEGNGPGIGAQVERRRSKRMHVALPVELEIDWGDGRTLKTSAIATNISEGGMFSEYLDLEAARQMGRSDDLSGRGVTIRLLPSANFPDACVLTGKINRKELRRHQLGLAIEFTGLGKSFS